MKLNIQLFGGRGASSGVSVSGKIYGSEFHTLLKKSNIKFIKYNESNEAKAPLETMTKGRVYVTVGKNDELRYITYYSDDGKRKKQIDLNRSHKNIKGTHTHEGYIHDENGTHNLTSQEKRMVDYVNKIWYNQEAKK